MAQPPSRTQPPAPMGQPSPGSETFAARIVLRPLASSLPLGFFAFGTGSVLLSALELGWVPQRESAALYLLVLVFVVPLELLAGVFAFLARDGGAATALSTLGAAWAGTASTLLASQPAQRSATAAVFLLTLAPLMLALATVALRGKPLFGALLLAGACRFTVVGAHEAGGPGELQILAGWIGVALGAFALYSGLALLTEDTQQRTVLPIGRRGRARQSLEGGIEEQLERIEGEAGVRRQL